ncbi:MAG TPA: hypothetical protein VGK73_06650 [Polyangiaceae bacterium]
MTARAAFNVKGLVYRGTQEFYARRLTGGLESLRRQLVDEAIVRFWEQNFSPGGWYDLFPLMAINQAAARVAGLPYTELVKENAAYIAERDINGVYRLLLKLASPELVASKLPRASLQYLDFGEAEGHHVGEKRFHAVQRRVPAAFAPWMTASVQGFAPTALRIVGAKDILITTRSVSQDAPSAENRTVELTHEISWR